MNSIFIRYVQAYSLSLLIICLSSCGGSGRNSPNPTEPPAETPTDKPGLLARPSNTSCLAGPRTTLAGNEFQLADSFPALRFEYPVAAKQAPNNQNRWYIVEKRGRILSFPNQADATQANILTFVDLIASRVDAQGARASSEGGLLGMAFHPNFAANGYVFLSYTSSNNPSGDNGGNFHSVIARYTSTDGGLSLDTASEELILTLPQPYGNHNGGDIAFGKDGYLYIGFGDGGSSGDPQNNGQNTKTLLGSILRIDVNLTSGEIDVGLTYKIPPSNPYASSSSCSDTACPEIFAWGLRNPWRWSFDRQTDDIWAGDVGQYDWEEIDRIQSGQNYGWGCYEGTHRYTRNNAKSDTQCGGSYIAPITEYNHTQGYSVTGGFVYRGSTIPALTGRYLFADYGSGRIWGITNPYSTPSTNLLLEAGFMISAFAEANDGELYVLQYGSANGAMHKIVPSSGGGSTGGLPAKLSETGCAESSDLKKASGGMIPYDINSRLWSDGAEKARWFAIPDGSQINIRADGNWEFPLGSVLRKDFYLAEKIFETRLLAYHDDGGWSGYSYEWNDAQTDATLLTDSKAKQIGIINWTYPSPTQCLTCHSAASARMLGPETAQMNRSFTYPSTGITANQLLTYNAIGLFSNNVPTSPQQMVNPADTSADISVRARSYLHVNCANCHQPGGAGLGPADLRFSTAFSNMNICNVAPDVGDLSIPGAKLLSPANLDLSILSVRMHLTDGDRMPPIGSEIVDTVGTVVIDAWINSISSCP